MTTKTRRNRAIAKLLGFKEYVIQVNGKPGPVAWV